MEQNKELDKDKIQHEEPAMNLIEANAILVDVAHQALASGVFKSFGQTAQVGEAVAMASSFVNSMAVDPKNKNFAFKGDNPNMGLVAPTDEEIQKMEADKKLADNSIKHD